MSIDDRLEAIYEQVINDPLFAIDKEKLAFYNGLGDFSVKPYHEIVYETNRKRHENRVCNSEAYSVYEKVYASMLKAFRLAKKRVRDEIIYDDLILNIGDKNRLDTKCAITIWIDGVIRETKREIYLLKEYSSVYSNTNVDMIGNYFESRYQNDFYLYKDTYIARIGSHEYGLHSTDETNADDKRALTNIIAYFYGKPLYLMTDNLSFNRQLDELYNNFDLYDLMTFRHKDFLTKDTNAREYLCKPVFKIGKCFPLIEIGALDHPQMLDSYHDSLKQFEPLPRCVFLYRVFEYAANTHYQRTIRPANYSQEEAIRYYYEKALEFDFTTIYTSRMKRPHKGIPLEEVEFKYVFTNYMNTLKKESRQIIDEWSEHHFLKNKSLGHIIYKTGRNRVAHGGSTNHRITYDYEGNYLHINNVNIILELIARYVIEFMNPSIYNITERATKYYR